ncbi:MAG: sodium-dependent transporter [Pseudolabrys sp.]
MSVPDSAAAVPRAQWKTRYGFILATLGAAIGIGNIWRFPYVMGENGGGAFLLVYLGAVLLVGLPMLLGELAVGRAARREAASAFAHLGRGRGWRQVGLLGVVVSFVILTYYSVIAGWAVKYFADFAWLGPVEPGSALAHFQQFTASTFAPLAWHAMALALAVAIVAYGVERGIERASTVLLPALALIVIVLAVHSLTLPGAWKGIVYLFAPDWSALAHPQVYLAALGQAFFSLGLAMGILVTYGSYIPEGHRLPASAVTIAFGDTFFAVVAAVVIFPAVFSFAIDPEQGPGLAFVVLPAIFARMTAGQVVGAAFFGLLVVAAVTSMVALIEICVAYVIERFRIGRIRAAALVGVGAFLLGVPSSLGFGLWSGVRLFGLPILDAVDFAASNVLLPLSGLAVAIFIGWHWREADARAAVGIRSKRLAHLWRLSVRYIAPAMIVIVLLRALSVL